MTRIVLNILLAGTLMVAVSGCALIGTALSAAVGYGIYKATSH